MAAPLANAIGESWKTFSRSSDIATTSELCSGIGASIRAKSSCSLCPPSSSIILSSDRLFPAAIDVLKRLGNFGPTVILSDGDVVFQPHKVERAGLADAVAGRVLIYIHKEEALDDVERRYPAEHYVVVDDKRRILAAVKQFWGERVTTVFARQGSYAHDPSIDAVATADLTIDHIADLLDDDLVRSWLTPPMPASRLEPAR